jgi:DNA-binding response OmpR family regulator
MPPSRAILLVDSDSGCGRAWAAVLRRAGHRVSLARTRAGALRSARRGGYDLAVVDIFVRGGGLELARELARSVPRLYLSVGARLLSDEVLEAALGFPVLRKAELGALLARPRVRLRARAS